jgi:hypothetical protein
LVRHVEPEALIDRKNQIVRSIVQIVKDEKIRTLSIPSESEQTMQQFSTYGGLMRSLADLTNEKFGAASQKMLIPSVVNMIRNFMIENRRGVCESNLTQKSVQLQKSDTQFCNVCFTELMIEQGDSNIFSSIR